MTLRPLREDEAAAAAGRAAVSMGGDDTEEAVERWRARIRAGEVWGLERDGAIVGQCRLLPTEHWFGGGRVPCLDIASVSVPPEYRGAGVARALMEDAAAHGRREGFGLSLLFPATTGMYRKLGWELAATWTRYRVWPRLVPPDGPAMRAADRDTDWAAIRSCNEAASRALPGPAVRGPGRWARLAEVPSRYVLDAEGNPGSVDAYALIRQVEVADDWQHGIRLEDWAATTPRGLAAVVGLVGRWQSFARWAQFTDTFPSRWSGLLGEQDLDASHLHAMARALDFGAAVAARGFPQAMALSVTLRVTDEEDGQGGPWRLEVADGKGRLSPAGGADVTLRRHGLAPLFTGFRSARELRLLGLLQGPEEALDLLDAAFAGPPPVLFDFF